MCSHSVADLMCWLVYSQANSVVIRLSGETTTIQYMNDDAKLRGLVQECVLKQLVQLWHCDHMRNGGVGSCYFYSVFSIYNYKYLIVFTSLLWK